ncbi:unnamed protein product [Effrenium voratum]|nr:unnamed protein product [Effrenium voratum]CAJ1456949.1 unnamed protein product [Effrenium voratum]
MRSQRIWRGLLLLALCRLGLRAFVPPPADGKGSSVRRRATATQDPPSNTMLVEVEEGLEVAAKDYLADLKKEMTTALRVRNETSMVSILNHFGPRSEDAWLASLLMQALKDLLPGMSGADLGFLVMNMAYSEIRAAPVWHELAEAAIDAGLVETYPRTLAEMAFGFAWVQWQQPDLFAVLQVAMKSCKSAASEEQKRAFAWACARAGQPATKLFGKAANTVDRDLAANLWGKLTGMAKSRSSGVKVLKTEPMPLLVMPEAVPMMHCDALIKLANEQQLWINSSQLIATNDNPTQQAMLRSARTSATALLAWHEAHPSVKAVRAWASHTLGVPENFIEPLQLVRYAEGQKYGAHMDWCGEKHPGLWLFGQRMATVLVYLNTIPEGEGGETGFDSLGIKVKPQKGSAVIWPNVNPAGHPERSSLHSALPMKGSTVKYAMNLWIRGQKQPDHSWIKWHR